MSSIRQEGFVDIVKNHRNLINRLFWCLALAGSSLLVNNRLWISVAETKVNQKYQRSLKGQQMSFERSLKGKTHIIINSYTVYKLLYNYNLKLILVVKIKQYVVL